MAAVVAAVGLEQRRTEQTACMSKSLVFGLKQPNSLTGQDRVGREVADLKCVQCGFESHRPYQ
jgi:hypothetical protein